MSQETLQPAPEFGATHGERFLCELVGRFHNDSPDRWKESRDVHNVGTNLIQPVIQA